MSEKANKLREELADLCHQQWTGWMEYLFSKCKHRQDGSLVIPKDLVYRWSRQMGTAYIDLSKKEQDSDRKEADKFIELLVDHDIINTPSQEKGDE